MLLNCSPETYFQTFVFLMEALEILDLLFKERLTKISTKRIISLLVSIRQTLDMSQNTKELTFVHKI